MTLEELEKTQATASEEEDFEDDDEESCDEALALLYESMVMMGFLSDATELLDLDRQEMSNLAGRIRDYLIQEDTFEKE